MSENTRCEQDNATPSPVGMEVDGSWGTPPEGAAVMVVVGARTHREGAQHSVSSLSSTPARGSSQASLSHARKHDAHSTHSQQ